MWIPVWNRKIIGDGGLTPLSAGEISQWPTRKQLDGGPWKNESFTWGKPWENGGLMVVKWDLSSANDGENLQFDHKKARLNPERWWIRLEVTYSWCKFRKMIEFASSLSQVFETSIFGTWKFGTHSNVHHIMEKIRFQTMEFKGYPLPHFGLAWNSCTYPNTSLVWISFLTWCAGVKRRTYSWRSRWGLDQRTAPGGGTLQDQSLLNHPNVNPWLINQWFVNRRVYPKRLPWVD